MAAETEIDRMLVRLIGDASDYINMLDSAKRESEQAAKEIERSLGPIEKKFTELAKGAESFANKLISVGGSMTKFGLVITAATAPLTLFLKSAFSTAVELESLRLGLMATVGSAEEADRQFRSLEEVAKLPGLGFKEAVQGAINLQNVGFTAEKAKRTLLEFGNAIATTGGGRNELDRILFQLTQMKSVGKVLGQDLRSILTTSPAIAKSVKAAFGTTSAEAINKAGISAEQFIDTLLDQLETLPRVAGGTANTIENLGDSFRKLKKSVGDVLKDFILPVMDALALTVQFLTETFSKLSPEMKRVLVGVSLIVVAIGPLLVTIGGIVFAVGQFILILPTLIAMFSAAAAAVGSFMFAMGPILLLALAAAAVAFVVMNAAMKDTEEGARRAAEAIAGINKELKIEDVSKHTNIEELRKQIENTKDKRDELQKSMDEKVVFGIHFGREARRSQEELDNLNDSIMKSTLRITELKTEARDLREEVEDFGPGGKAAMKATEELTQSLEYQIATFGKTRKEIELYKLELMKATPEQLESASAALTTLEELEKLKITTDKAADKKKKDEDKKLEASKRMTAEGKALTEKWMDPAVLKTQKLAEAQKHLWKMVEEDTISMETYTKEFNDLNKEVTATVGAFNALSAVGKGTSDFEQMLLNASMGRGVVDSTATGLPGRPSASEPFSAPLDYGQTDAGERDWLRERESSTLSAVVRAATGIEELVRIEESKTEIILESTGLEL